MDVFLSDVYPCRERDPQRLTVSWLAGRLGGIWGQGLRWRVEDAEGPHQGKISEPVFHTGHFYGPFNPRM